MKRTCKVNISIDDVSPHPQSSVKVLDRCEALLKKYPAMKFTLFIPAAYWRTKGKNANAKPYYLSKCRAFCLRIRDLPDCSFEIGYHGYYHGIIDVSNNDEFKTLSYAKAKHRFNQMFAEVDEAGLKKKFKLIFRPPGWRMSKGAIQAACTVGFSLLSLSDEKKHKIIYDGMDEWFSRFRNVISRNIAPPFKMLRLSRKTEIVYHACEWDKNCLDKAKAKELSNFLIEKNVEFSFIEDLV